MQSPLIVRPGQYRQFASPSGTFCLVVDAELADECVVEGPHGYDKTLIVPVDRDESLESALTSAIPDAADLLVVRPGTFVTSPDPAAVGARRISVMPCGSTPVTTEQIRYFLTVLERSDPVAQAARADRFFAALEEADAVHVVDEAQDTDCTVRLDDLDLDFNLQAGPLDPGEQQIAPSGEVGVLPMAITGFDATRRLPLDGRLTLRGWPIVHAGYDPGLDRAQDTLFRQLLPLHRHPVVVDVADGAIGACRPGDDDPATAAVTRTLEALLDSDARYRTVWELGFGLNTDMEVVPANCGLNEVYGARNGVVHLGLGLTPFTRFALTFLCPAATVVDGGSRVVLGAEKKASRRIRRTKSAGCGCH